MSNSIYSQIILSKSGIHIPVLQNGKTVDSRYDPERESLRLIEQIKTETHFVIVIGIASGVFVKTLLEKRKDIFILAVEKTDEDLVFLKQLPIIQKLFDNKTVTFCSIQELENKITQLYVPAFYGNLQVIEQRSWTLENSDCIEQINEQINKATGLVSADFSVQSHFGKLWQHNILNNIKNIDNNAVTSNFPTEKTAVILAAGPSLDFTIKEIINEPDKYFLIATDTALSILSSYGIQPQVVVSLDGQNISNLHFMHNSKFNFSNTLFLFDLCANSSAVNQVKNNKGNYIFFTNGHPLSEYLNRHYNLNLHNLFSGAGTVTISAFDFALKTGFKNIKVIGADFSYSNGKPYAKGTYLDRIYNKNSDRLSSTQKSFSSLEFRTELIKQDNKQTTQVLQAYRTSFENYLTNNNCSFEKQNDVYIVKCNNISSISFINKPTSIDGKKILSELIHTFSGKNRDKEFNTIFDLSESDICILPLISWLRNHDNIDKSDFKYYYKKALQTFSELGEN